MGWYYNKISTAVSADGFRFPPRVWVSIPAEADGSAAVMALVSKGILGWRKAEVDPVVAISSTVAVAAVEEPGAAVQDPEVQEVPKEQASEEPSEVVASSESLVARRRRGSHG
jgi:hypothetical protein